MFFIENCPICNGKNNKTFQAIMMPFVSEITGIWTPFQISKKQYFDLKEGTSYFTTYTVQCDCCGLVYAKHRFSENELKNLYGKYRGFEYNRLRMKHEANYRLVDDYLSNPVSHLGELNNLLRKYKPDIKTVLDWGGGNGTNTPCVKEADYVATYDPANNDEFLTIKGNFDQPPGGKFFDLITCMHVLEHVNFPCDTIKKALQYLSDTGLMYIEVPLENQVDFNYGGIKSGSHKIHWHEHINCFSKNSIQKLFENLNLTILYISTIDLSDSFRNFTAIQCIVKQTVKE